MTLGSKAIAAFALLILLAIGVLSFRSTVQDDRDRGWVTHTHIVIEKLQTILIDITEAETGQRGYLLTGDKRYLAPYIAGVSHVHGDIEMLRELTSDNPRQQEGARQLDTLITSRIVGLSDRMEIRKRFGLVSAVDEAEKADNGKEMMDKIRRQIDQMRQAEELLLSQRLEVAAVGARNLRVVIVLGNALAILILTVAGAVIHRETAKRSLAERGLRQINVQLEQRTVELLDANHEMESFSYSVAHDLRAPLRQIAGYSRVLLQDYGPRFDEEPRHYLEKVEDGARKMGRLVDDLLGLSKIGRQELSLQVTSLDKLLQHVVDELEPEWREREVEWQIGELFSIDCDPALMHQVFANLLSNAVKYTRKKQHAVIQVGQIRQDQQRVIFIRDNGAGFEMQYVGKLFGVFQRLHKARDFEGTGVGLAIVQRIIRKHGGRIWAEAKLDEGATFFFTLGSSDNKPGEEPEPRIDPEVTNVARS
jgi:signal transduction histidine kinase